jgi:hypothetical protein
MPRSHQTSTVSSLVLFLLLAHASLASPIVKIANPIVIKTSLNATSSLPVNGPNRYAALALGGAEGGSLESRELTEYFQESELVARGLGVGEAEPAPTPVSQVEREQAPEATQRSLFSFLSRPILAIKNPKYIWNPKAHPPRTSTTTRSWSSFATSTAAAPASTLVACALTADCAGQPIPDYSHQYCASKICSFREFLGLSCSLSRLKLTLASLAQAATPASPSRGAPASRTRERGAPPKLSHRSRASLISPTPCSSTSTTQVPITSAAPPAVPSPTGCFPSSRSDIPTTPATASSLQQWWCPESTEYAFLVRLTSLGSVEFRR